MGAKEGASPRAKGKASSLPSFHPSEEDARGVRRPLRDVARVFFRDGFDQNTPPAFRPPRFFRELCQVLGSLHDTLAPLHSRDIQRRDHGRDAEDGRLGPLTFVARPATPLALRRRAGLSRTVPRVARTANREHSSFREASRASARAPAFFFQIGFLRPRAARPRPDPSRFANAPASAVISIRAGVDARVARAPVTKDVRRQTGGVRATRYASSSRKQREKIHVGTCTLVIAKNECVYVRNT